MKHTLLILTLIHFGIIDTVYIYAQSELLPDSLLEFKEIGPTIFGGRVTDIEANPSDPTDFYVAYATGGLWHTTNNGQSFTPLLDRIPRHGIGDIAVNWKKNILWVGTGENNSSRSSYPGHGILKSEDGGKTWEHLGLENTNHIGRIVLHPTQPETLWVGALGHLYTKNKERGVYKSIDGGRTWDKVLYLNDSSGCVDLVIHPKDPNTLFAAMWERDRKAWNFKEAGPSSGIYKSTDGGQNWQKISLGHNGFPNNPGLGRIGLDIVLKDDSTYLFAVLDNQNERSEKTKSEQQKSLSKESFKKMSISAFLDLDSTALQEFLTQNDLPTEYSVSYLKEKVASGVFTPNVLYEYLHDPNESLFNTNIVGPQVYISYDLGTKWHLTHEDHLDKVFYTYGYYFGQIRANPKDPNELYIFGVPFLRSSNRGKTWTYNLQDHVHVDHHALWINPSNPHHMILGNDGGVYISYDHGEHWGPCNHIPVGQFYTVGYDMAQPYQVYGGLQDNGVWMGPHNYSYSTGWMSTGQYPYKRILGGDGMQVQTDPRDPNIVYTGYQYGNYARLNNEDNTVTWIKPKHSLGEAQLRFNWQTPIWLSKHQPDILYLGSQKVHRSLDQGDNWSVISPDLTHGIKKGDVTFGTITTIHESPLQFGLLYVGSDDGRIHVSKDHGTTWTDISLDLPRGMWVSRIWASAHETGRVYCSLNGYRQDNTESYVYRSDDFGAHWTRIGKNQISGAVNVVKEDANRPEVIYVGSDDGLFLSTNFGKTFRSYQTEVYHTPVHDLSIQPRENDLLLATHGRSLIRIDLTTLYEYLDNAENNTLHLFSMPPLKYSKNWGNKNQVMETEVPKIKVKIWSTKSTDAVLSLHLQDGDFFEKKIHLKNGITTVEWNLDLPQETKTYPEKGSHTITVRTESDNERSAILSIE